MTAERTELRLPVVAEENVAGFDVPMDFPLAVEVQKALEDIADDNLDVLRLHLQWRNQHTRIQPLGELHMAHHLSHLNTSTQAHKHTHTVPVVF